MNSENYTHTHTHTFLMDGLRCAHALVRFLLLLTARSAYAIHGEQHCTAVAVDSAASTEATGAAFVGMNTDCSNCDNRVAWVPSKKITPGAKRKVYINSGPAPRLVAFGHGEFYEPKEGEQETIPLGEIDEASLDHTYGYWESSLALMNDQGLGFAESSCDTLLMNQSPGDATPGGSNVVGILDITTLIQIAAERCATARCAVETMGALAEEHGFFPMGGEWSGGTSDGKAAYDGGGEAVVVSDRNGEAWVFHVVGGILPVSKSAWAAQRVPHGHLAVVPNTFIIRDLPPEPNSDFLFSPTIRAIARAAQLWHGGDRDVLDFARVFGVNEENFVTGPSAPIPLYSSLRLWGLFNLARPSNKLPLYLDPLKYPFSVKVEKKITHRDVQAWLSTYYEGTEFDMSAGILSGPFGNPFLLEGGPAMNFGQLPRGVALSRTVYSIVNESPMNESKLGIAWYAPDTPITSVYMPLIAQNPLYDPSFAIGVNTNFTRESAWWAFDIVSNWASNMNYRNSSIEDILPLKKEFEDRMDHELSTLNDVKTLKEAGEWATRTQKETVSRWWDLFEHLLVKYNDGFYNDLTKPGSTGIGQNIGFPVWWAKMIGFNQDIHPIFVERTLDLDQDIIIEGQLPRRYEFLIPTGWTGSSWVFPSYASGAKESEGAAHIREDTHIPEDAIPSNIPTAYLAGFLAVCCSLLVGAFFGRRYEQHIITRSQQQAVDEEGTSSYFVLPGHTA